MGAYRTFYEKLSKVATPDENVNWFTFDSAAVRIRMRVPFQLESPRLRGEDIRIIHGL